MAELKKGEGRPQVQEFRGERSTKLLQVSTESTAHMKAYVKGLKERMDQGEPVIWAEAEVPKELIWACDVPVQYPLNYSAVCAAKQMGPYYLNAMNQRGFFRDLCRYCAMPLGYVWDRKNDIAPWGGMPKPTAMVATAMDDPIEKIWELFGREYNVPLYLLDRPAPDMLAGRWWEDFRGENDETEPFKVESQVKEFEGFIAFMEALTGKIYTESNMRRTVELGNQMYHYFWKATDLAAGTKPCPITIADCLSNIGSYVFFPGTEFGAEHGRKYYEEIKDRVDKGMGAIPNEKVRLFFAGVPPWFSPGFANAFEDKYGTIFIPQNYFSGAEANVRKDLSRPLEVLASRRVQGNYFTNLPPHASDWYVHLAKKFKVDGIVFLMAESCKLLYSGRLFAFEALRNEGIPSMQLIADMNDARDWDDVKMKSLVSSFIETLLP